MCKFLLKIVLSVLLIFSINSSGAQKMSDPTFWTYEAKKIKTGEYELVFRLRLEEGWHIAALNQNPNGLLNPPVFNFEENKGFERVSNLIEKGKLITEKVEDLSEEITYYKNEVTYTLKIKSTAGNTISGNHEYQVCNDMLCLPPTDKNFTFTLD